MIETPLFFIVGRGRSGTTLLKSMLDAHPNIKVAHESQFMRILYQKYHKKTTWSKTDLESFYNDLWLDPKIHLWPINKEGLQKSLLAHQGTQSYAELCKVVYTHFESLYPTKDLQLIGDKNPVYSLFVDKLIQLYPEAKFIHVVRDYRAVAEAHLRVPYEAHNIASLCYRWNLSNKKIEALKEKHPDQFLLLKYEDLITRPKSELERICTFLNVPFEEHTLNYGQGKDSLKAQWGGVFDWHKNTFKPPITSKINAWESALTPTQIATAETVSHTIGEKYGYRSITPRKDRPRNIATFPGLLLGWLYPFVERVLLRFPLSLSKRLFHAYGTVTNFEKSFKERAPKKD